MTATTAASIFTDAWDKLAERDRQYLFLLLLGFLGAFGFIRLSTRLMRSPKVPWWPGSIKTGGGVHVHHLVFGIVAMMVAGALSFAIPEASQPWYSIYAVVFGIGMGLTIDEYALWLRLDDVYWAREGRSSIDAALIAVVFLALVLLAATPSEISTDTFDDFAATFGAALVHFGWVVICLVKQRFSNALIGTFIPFVAPYAALRLGKPDSPWAKRFYGARNPRKQARAERRFRPDRRTDVFKERLRDAIGGVTEEEYQARLAAAASPVNPSLGDR
jgi:hypothetical protein